MISSRLVKAFPLILIPVVGLIIYTNSLVGEFVFDDIEFIVNNPAIKYISNLSALWQGYMHPTRFITALSFALNYHFHQLDVFGYHLINVLIHVFNAFLVRKLVLLLISTPRLKRSHLEIKKEGFALLSAMIFLTHPVQTQAVSYISQRFASLATFFYLACLCCYLIGRLSKVQSKRRKYLISAFVLGFLGMFTKEIVFTLPVVVLLIEGTFLTDQNQGGKRLPKGMWALGGCLVFLILIIPALFKMNVVGILSKEIVSRSHINDLITSQSYLLTQFRVILRYIQLLWLPIGQNLDYDFALSKSLLEPQTALGLLVVGLLILTAIRLRKKYVFISFGIFWFFITLSVESSIIPIPHVIFEHRLYLPSVGFAILFSALILHFVKNKNLAYLLGAVIIIIFSVLTIQRNYVWRNPVVLWSDVIKKSPFKARGYNNLGFAFAQVGQAQAAFALFNKAIALDPRHAEAYCNRGKMYQEVGQFDLATNDYNRALEINPRYADVFNNQANIFNATGRIDEAQAYLKNALAIKPNFPQAYNNLGLIYLQKKQFDEALKMFENALILRPDFAEGYNNRGIAYIAKKDQLRALADFQRAVALKPNYQSALNNLQALNQRSTPLK